MSEHSSEHSDGELVDDQSRSPSPGPDEPQPACDTQAAKPDHGGASGSKAASPSSPASSIGGLSRQVWHAPRGPPCPRDSYRRSLALLTDVLRRCWLPSVCLSHSSSARPPHLQVPSSPGRGWVCTTHRPWGVPWAGHACRLSPSNASALRPHQPLLPQSPPRRSRRAALRARPTPALSTARPTAFPRDAALHALLRCRHSPLTHARRLQHLSPPNPATASRHRLHLHLHTHTHTQATPHTSHSRPSRTDVRCLAAPRPAAPTPPPTPCAPPPP